MKVLINILRNRLVQTLFFWAVSFTILLRVFSRGESINPIDIIYTSLFHLHLIIAVSVNTFLFIPQYLEKKMYAAYMSGLLTLLGTSYFIYHLSYDVLADWIFSGFYFVAVYEWYETIGILSIYLISTSLLEFSKGWFREAELRKELAETKELNAENELKVLRAQINPPFLFNSLNTIYGMTLTKDEKAPETVLALSDILRYNLNAFGHEDATLKEEIGYLKNYLNLQKKRLDFPNQVELHVTGDAGEKKFPSLMLIEFLENALKHGNIDEEGAYIRIEIAIRDSELDIRCVNSIGEQPNSTQTSGGMGLENCKRRLELLYPAKHSFNMEQNTKEFTITMRLSYE